MIHELKKAVIAKLSGNSSLTGALSASNAIYWEQAPESASLPFVVVSYSSGGEENDTPTDSFDVDVVVKVITTTSTSASSIADTIRSTLHRQTLTFDTYATVKVTLTALIDYVENVERAQYWHSGGIYRIRASL